MPFKRSNRPFAGPRHLLRSAASIRPQASRARPKPSGHAIRPSFRRGRISGIRMYGSRNRPVPLQASTATSDSAGTSGSGAARWRIFASRIPTEIRACRIALFCVAGPAMAETAGRADGRIEQWPLRHLLPWSKMNGERTESRSRPLQFKCRLLPAAQRHYRLMRMRHGRTNFAGQPSMRMEMNA